MHKKPTLVIGASTNPDRYAFKAVEKLIEKQQPVYAEGLKVGQIQEVTISNQRLNYSEIDTVTLYVGPRNQPNWYDYILGLKPKRIIFNPGTENDTLKKMAEEQGIETIEACTLVLLSIGNY